MDSKPHNAITSTWFPWPLVDDRDQASYMLSLDRPSSLFRLPEPGSHSPGPIDGPLYHVPGSGNPYAVTSVWSTVSPQASPAKRYLDVDNGCTPTHELQVGQHVQTSPMLFDTTRWVPSGIHTDPYRHPSVVEHGYSAYGELLYTGHEDLRAAFGGAANVPKLQRLPVVPSTQPVSMYNLGSLSLMNHVDIGNNLSTYITSPRHLVKSCSAPSASPPSGQHADAATGERQRPVILYHVSPKRSLGGRRGRHARAINVDGLWIDEDELVHGVNEASGIINVHQCQWARSKNPCGMWVIGTKAFIASHIRKWHTKSREDRKATKCQWHGCDARGMLKDSISRHVVSVHLGEVFSAKDVTWRVHGRTFMSSTSSAASGVELQVQP
ncbi:hypothetical protein BU15DRAFT_67660 [Melanogaster broomeanus]|nr:hypothetical protein BU15DRAFT_67660 [Melanogaster broomeanus]